MKANRLRTLALLTALLIGAGFALVFFYAPNEADQGFIQKIFYLHVPLAIVALVAFVAGGLFGLQFLRTDDRKWDLRSYVAIHMAQIYGVAVLITGAIWAKASWGHWWVWDEPTLVSFLIVFLLYCCYQPLRFAIEDPERQARYAAVFACVAGAFVPLKFLAVRMAQSLAHPRVLSATGGSMPGDMRLTFVVSLVGVACLFVALCRYELAAKQAHLRVRAIRRRLLGDDDLGAPQRSAWSQGMGV
jgi:heme exporter protein C